MGQGDAMGQGVGQQGGLTGLSLGLEALHPEGSPGAQLTCRSGSPSTHWNSFLASWRPIQRSKEMFGSMDVMKAVRDGEVLRGSPSSRGAGGGGGGRGGPTLLQGVGDGGQHGALVLARLLRLRPLHDLSFVAAIEAETLHGHQGHGMVWGCSRPTGLAPGPRTPNLLPHPPQPHPSPVILSPGSVPTIPC